MVATNLMISFCQRGVQSVGRYFCPEPLTKSNQTPSAPALHTLYQFLAGILSTNQPCVGKNSRSNLPGTLFSVKTAPPFSLFHCFIFTCLRIPFSQPPTPHPSSPTFLSHTRYHVDGTSQKILTLHTPSLDCSFIVQQIGRLITATEILRWVQLRRG